MRKATAPALPTEAKGATARTSKRPASRGQPVKSTTIATSRAIAGQSQVFTLRLRTSTAGSKPSASAPAAVASSANNDSDPPCGLSASSSTVLRRSWSSGCLPSSQRATRTSPGWPDNGRQRKVSAPHKVRTTNADHNAQRTAAGSGARKKSAAIVASRAASAIVATASNPRAHCSRRTLLRIVARGRVMRSGGRWFMAMSG